MILSASSKALGFFRDLFLAFYYGTSTLADIYNLSAVIPPLVFGLFATAVGDAYTVYYPRIIATRKSDEVSVLNQLILCYVLLSSLVAAIAIFFSTEITHLIMPALSQNDLETAVYFTKWSIYSIIPLGVVAILSSLFTSKEYQLPVSLVGLPLNLATIAVIYISSVKSSTILATSMVVSNLVQIIFLVAFLKKIGFRAEIRGADWSWLVKICKRSLPILVISLFGYMSLHVNRTLSSSISNGAATAFTFSDRLIILFLGLFILNLSSITFPKAASYIEIKNYKALQKLLDESLRLIMLFGMPATIMFFAFSQEIISLLYERGQFDARSVVMTANCLQFYALGIVAFSLRDVLYKFFFSAGYFSELIVANLISLSLTVSLGLYLSSRLGLVGIGLAVSVSSLALVVVMMRILKIKMGINFNLNYIENLKVLVLCLGLVFLLKLDIFPWQNGKFYDFLQLITYSVIVGCYIVLKMFGTDKLTIPSKG